MKTLAMLIVVTSTIAASAQLSVHIQDGKVVVVASQPVDATGFDLQSAGGFLVPIPDPPGAAPFTFLLANTANQITWGNLGTTVRLDGVWETQAGYQGDAPADDLIFFRGIFGEAPGSATTSAPRICPGDAPSEFVNLDFDESHCSGTKLFGWSSDLPVSLNGLVLLARVPQSVVYEGDSTVGGGWGFIPSIEGKSLYLDASDENPVSIAQLGTVPEDARSLLVAVNQYHNNFEVRLGDELLDLVVKGRAGDTLTFAGDVASFAGQMLELQITSLPIDLNNPIPDGPDAGEPRALILDNIRFSNLPVPEPSGVLLFTAGLFLLPRGSKPR